LFDINQHKGFVIVLKPAELAIVTTASIKVNIFMQTWKQYMG